METEKVFTNGMSFKEPRENAPDFIIGKVSFKVDEFVAWLQANVNNNGWVDVDLKRSKKGTIYGEKNTYKPQKPNMAHGEVEEDQIPF